MKQKICALALTAALSTSLLITPAFAAEVSFTDTSGHWAAQAISTVVEKNLFQGTSEDTFSPDVSMNRGMFVTVLGRFAKSMGYDVTGTPAFTDVAETAYYAPFVAWASTNGIVQGVGEGKFAPDQSVTREQMCALFVRFLTFVGYPLPTDGQLSFVDENQISDYAKDPVQTAVALGLIKGSETANGVEFRPDSSATRAEVATVFVRLSELEGIMDLKPAEPSTPTTPDTPSTPTTPTTPETPSNPGGGGGGGGAVTPTTPTNPTTPENPQPTAPTEEDIAKEAEVVGYLQTMSNNYATSDYINSIDAGAKKCLKILMDAINDALKSRAENKDVFLSKDYVMRTYEDAIAEFKATYNALTKEQKDDVQNAVLVLESLGHLQVVMGYFGINIKL